MKSLFLISTLFIFSIGNTQTVDFNNVSCTVAANGFMEGYKVPKNSDIVSINSMSLCLAGKDLAGQLKSAVGTYSPNGSDFSPGPYSTTSAYSDPTYINAYSSSVWEVSLTEIQNHIANFNQVGYTMPAGIANWPGNGIAGLGVSQNLASFIDLNSNGIYEPTLGDYPEIRGDFATLVIMNDVAAVTMSQPMGIEVLALFYQFNENDYRANTTFVNYKVINRSSQTFLDFKLGLYTDFDLGNSTDDYFGCDSTKNLMYVYNADNNDENNGTLLGYLNNPPSIGVLCLNHEIDNVVAFNNISSFPYNEPTTPVQFYNLMDGKWNDGSLRYFGGNGTNSTSSAPTSFMFSGNPNEMTGWSEGSLSIQPGDRIGFMSTSMDIFQPFEYKCFDFAILYAREPGNNNLQNVHELLDLATIAQADFDAMQDYNCNLLTAAINELEATQVGLFPNPSNGKFTLSFGNEILNGTISIRDLNGKVVLIEDFDQSNSTDLEVTAIPGIYHISIQSNKGLVNKKLVITE